MAKPRSWIAEVTVAGIKNKQKGYIGYDRMKVEVINITTVA